jgi:hypothetical protein
MKRILMATVIGASVASGAALGSPPAQQPPKVPDAAKCTGTYYLGTDLSLNLHPDGIYDAAWIGGEGQFWLSTGHWQIERKSLTLTPVNEADWMRDIMTLDIVERDGRIYFVEPRWRDDLMKYGAGRGIWCFRRVDQTKQQKGG